MNENFKVLVTDFTPKSIPFEARDKQLFRFDFAFLDPRPLNLTLVPLTLLFTTLMAKSALTDNLLSTRRALS